MTETAPINVKTSIVKEIKWAAEKNDELYVLNEGRTATVVFVWKRAYPFSF